MWSSAGVLQAVSIWCLWIGSITGGIAVIAALVGALAANRASELEGRAADIKIAEAQAQAEKARLEAARLWQEMAWRRVAPAQRNRLIEALRGEPFRVSVESVGSDPESTVFRDDLAGAFAAAGLQISGNSGWTRAVGLRVMAPPSPDRDRLTGALQAAGFPHEVSDESRNLRSITLLVGSKPAPAYPARTQ